MPSNNSPAQPKTPTPRKVYRELNPADLKAFWLETVARMEREKKLASTLPLDDDTSSQYSHTSAGPTIPDAADYWTVDGRYFRRASPASGRSTPFYYETAPTPDIRPTPSPRPSPAPQWQPSGPPTIVGSRAPTPYCGSDHEVPVPTPRPSTPVSNTRAPAVEPRTPSATTSHNPLASPTSPRRSIRQRRISLLAAEAKAQNSHSGRKRGV
jgi:hypothetical protein